ncbi:hypothetical protein [Providencia rettgeri]|uniref:hypothetical protein n=1 Tax=Providencia rettgeri TaxID=587 RepID=UPI0034E0AE0C
MMLSHNSAVSNITKKITAIVNSANSKEEFNRALKLSTDFGQPLKYNNANLYITACSALIICLFAIALGYQSTNGGPWDNIFICVIAVSLVVTLISLGICLFRKSKIQKISNQIYTGIALLDYGINPLPRYNGRVNQLLDDFLEFDRGNYSRKIMYEYETFPESETQFNFYRFEYVDKIEKEETTSDSKGNTTTRTVTHYEHYYRYGLITDYHLFSNIAVISNGAVPFRTKYQPASMELSKYFKFGAESELELAKWLKPTIVEILLDARQIFKNLNIEINHDGIMCISFSTDDVIKTKHQYNLENIDDFKTELQTENKLPKLKQLIDFYKRIIKYTDNNFSNKDVI